jgi:hypothetical protein
VCCVHGAAGRCALDDGWRRIKHVQLRVPIATTALATTALAQAAAAAAIAAAAIAAAAIAAQSKPTAAAISIAATRSAAAACSAVAAEPADGCGICMCSALGAGSRRCSLGLHRARRGQHDRRVLPLHLHGRLERARLLCRAGRRRPGSRSAPSVPASARQPHGASGGARRGLR